MATPDSLTDAELLSNTDAASFAEFYRRHARQVGGYLMRSTRDAEVAADLTAETFAAALASRSRYRPDRGAASTWLFAIAGHKLSDWQRNGYAEDRARRRLGLERPPLSEDDVHEFERLASAGGVGELLDELPPEQRGAVRARFVDERDYGDIAGEQGVSEVAVRQRVSRGLASLRRRMGARR
jgi:RNA polymerase sigma factor (sigma-70 family)